MEGKRMKRGIHHREVDEERNQKKIKI